MSEATISEVSKNGLWNNNPALVQLLGLCPLLAVTGTVVNALGLGIATLMVLIGSNCIVSLIRNHVSDAVRLPAFVIIIAAFVTCAELLMKAFTYELYQILGIFIPLIVTNCAILGRAEAFASKNHIGLAALDGLMMGLGFLLVLVALGALRTVWPGNPVRRHAPAVWPHGRQLDSTALRRQLQLPGSDTAPRRISGHRPVDRRQEQYRHH